MAMAPRGQPNSGHTDPGGRRGRAAGSTIDANMSDLENQAAECAICLAEFEDGDAVRVMPACRHTYHASCIERWLAAGRRSSCPTCRAPSAVTTTAAAAAAAQPDEATNRRREPNSGALDEREVCCFFMFGLQFALMLVGLIDEAVRHFRGK